MLPLGLRVLNKIERLVDKHMQGIGASKVSLSSISSELLWQRSGRLEKGRTSEFFQFEDRKGAKYLLSPTHEEEITALVAEAVHSYRDLPLRLYQVSRKYRDELRPRHGLLRGREFIMKDLYTFDVSDEQARKTYEEVRHAYVAFLKDLKLPYLMAQADSGNMGGNLSHEYHFASVDGEDTVIECVDCGFSMNEELYIGRYDESLAAPNRTSLQNVRWRHYVSKDRATLCTIYYDVEHGDPNIYAVKAVFRDVDPSLRDEEARNEHKTQNSSPAETHIHFRDPRLSTEALRGLKSASTQNGDIEYKLPVKDDQLILLTKATDGSSCPSCRNHTLKLRQAVEIGHTFHLGTRYSLPLSARVLNADNTAVHVSMGCHGIGVSRLVGAIAGLLADEKGLNWPLAIAPFSVLLVASDKAEPAEVEALYDQLVVYNAVQPGVDVAIDDRERSFGWKLNDADLVGYPFIVIMGKKWKQSGLVELQCRRLGIKTDVNSDKLAKRIADYSTNL